MKKILFITFATIMVFAHQITCAIEPDSSGNNIGRNETKPEKETVESQKIRDMVLVYSGGDHREFNWNSANFGPYVSLPSSEEETHEWLFDGYLFLELFTGTTPNKMYASRYGMEPAQKLDWIKLVTLYFQDDNGVRALNDRIGKVKGKVTEDKFEKRKVVFSLPEPIPNQTNWGEVDGKAMDFSKDEDRTKAVRWYIDYIADKFETSALENVNLVGFYWLAEEDDNTKHIVKSVADFIHEKGYKFYWIPWFSSPGFDKWEQYGFDEAFHQPNHFFKTSVPDERIEIACQLAKQHGLSMEVEFDERAVTGGEEWGRRYDAYIDGFIKQNIFRDQNVAYYQGSSAWYGLWSGDDKARMRYNRLARIIADRQKSKDTVAK